MEYLSVYFISIPPSPIFTVISLDLSRPLSIHLSLTLYLSTYLSNRCFFLYAYLFLSTFALCLSRVWTSLYLSFLPVILLLTIPFIIALCIPLFCLPFSVYFPIPSLHTYSLLLFILLFLSLYLSVHSFSLSSDSL